MRKIRILHAITHLGVGGALDNTLLTIQGLSRRRFQVDLVAGETCPDDCYTSREGHSRAVADRLFLIADLRRPVHLGRDWRALKELVRLFRDEQYDVVHTHGSKAGVLGRIAARHARVPVVLHTCHGFSWQVARQPERRLVHRWRRSAKRWLYLQVDRYAASLSDALITVAELNKQDAIRCGLAPPAKLTTIYSGIDLSQLERVTSMSSGDNKVEVCQEHDLCPQRPLVGMVGRLCPQKAPLDFVAAARILLRRRPDVQVVIAGDGPLADQVRQAIGDDSRIRMLGFMDQAPRLIGALDVFALASLWEGLGRALTEALILGIPAAVTAVDGVPELVTHGETGLLSPPGDPQQLANNMVWLLDHPEQARALGARARQRVAPEFGAERMVERIAALYERLLDDKRHPSTPAPVGTRQTVEPQSLRGSAGPLRGNA